MVQETSKPTEKPPVKKYYDVVIEINSPITMKYKVLAFDEKEAAKIVEEGKGTLTFVSKPKMHKTRIKSLIVYTAGTVMRLFSYQR